MANPKLPIDYNGIRAALVQVCEKVTGLTVIMEEPETQNVPRPKKPYMSMKITSPGLKRGDDDKRYVPNSGGVWTSGGQRNMKVDFNCYGTSHEEAYGYLALWQASLDLEDVQEQLRRSGIAVWSTGNVADLSQLLNTGYEGRAHMECSFGIVSNISSDLGRMDSVEVEGDIANAEPDIDVTVPN